MPPSPATSPPRAWGDTAFLALVAVTAALFAYCIYLVFFVAPVEAQMGIVQKIFYFHVPSAYCCYLGVTACFVGSVGYLWKRSDKWDAVARAGGELAVVFILIVLITGPLWGKKAWGVYWTWDPRLTSTMLLGLLYGAYVVMRAGRNEGDAERRFAAGLGALAIIDVPIIHFSVRLWRGQHPTVISRGGGGLDPVMKQTFLFSMVAFTLLFVVLLVLRVRGELLEQRLRRTQVRAAELGRAGGGV
jgi:heme exporter protein C